MRARKTATLLPPILAALAIVALTLYAYRSLAARPFAADDYEWLLSVRGLSFGALLRRAFDPAAQTHFYRPLIWLLFWIQTRAFGLDPRGFHAVSLALHLLNAALLGGLAYRLTPKCKIENVELNISARERFLNLQFAIPLLAMAIVALHPAPFEAVVWISAQSELLAAALLLAALHVWLPRQGDQETRRHGEVERRLPFSPSPLLPFSLSPRLLVATLALGLALLAKESAVIGLPLLMLLGLRAKNKEQRTENQEPRTDNCNAADTETRRHGDTEQVAGFSLFNFQFSIFNFTLPALLTLGYIVLQIVIEQRNYLLKQGGYGLGAQVVLNPLRSLALLVAPLAGTEHADAQWLVPLGAIIAIGLLGFWILDWGFWKRLPQSKILNPKSKIILALGLTLLPTAPFASPPDSRYLYLPVMAAALLVGVISNQLRVTSYRRRAWPLVTRYSSLVTIVLVLALAGWAAGELHAREGRFAAASGPGGSLWQVATWACAESRPERVIVVAPPVAAPHVGAIIDLACGPDVRTKIVKPDQVEGALKARTLVIAFPNGSAEVQRWP